MLRELQLPDDVTGKVFLRNMPGFLKGKSVPADFVEAVQQIDDSHVQTIVCLASMEEINKKSPAYAEAINGGELPCAYKSFPLPDRQPPPDLDAFSQFITEIADEVRNGNYVLIHCKAGRGRTGMVAACLLIRLGVDTQTAISSVRKAGSTTDNANQRDFILSFR